MRDGITALRDVRFHHPGVSAQWARAGQGLHGVQGATLWALSIPTAPDVRRVEGCEATRYGPWQARSCSGGHAPRALGAIPLGPRGASDECGAGPLRLQTLDTVVEGRVEGLRGFLGASLLHPGGGILPDVAPARRQQVLVEPPLAVAAPLPLVTCSLRRSALQGGGPGQSEPACAGPGACAGCVCLAAPAPCARRSRRRVL